MLVILKQILPFFSIMGLGWLMAHFKIANEKWNKTIGDFALYIGFPALIFSGLMKNEISYATLSQSFFANSIFILGIVIGSILIFKLLPIKNTDKATYLLCLIFGNVAFLGIPLITSINPELLQEATLNTAVHLFWIFSVGLFMVEYWTTNSPKLLSLTINLLKNPLFLAVIFGLGFNLLRIKLNTVITTPIDMLGTAVSPVVMLMIGIFIKINPINNIKKAIAPALYSSIKLLGVPVLGIVIVNYFFDLNDYFSVIIDIAMPVAITPFALASHYNLNKEFISTSIVICTVASVLTIPFIIELMHWLS